ncbi:MAG TPA: winged helix-turn-helix domain-containing protein [Acidimicrobiia bacterium]|jgi:DNA-binding transcriptional ArsR family regulator|nr:winged helix-turn-helix domain-containing protein [Acidimicrobiia bacterium]
MPTNADRSEVTSSGADYAMDATVEASTPAQLKALADDTRRTILDLLLDRAATTTHIAAALEKPKGTVGYHLKVLEGAGLIRVVRTAQVRAMTEKYYGRVARTILVKSHESRGTPFPVLAEAMQEARVLSPDHPLPMFTLRHMRIPEERAVEFAERLAALSEEFVDLPRSGDVVYGLIAGVFPTDRPTFPEGDRG